MQGVAEGDGGEGVVVLSTKSDIGSIVCAWGDGM